MEETMMNVTEELVMETKGTKIGKAILLVAGVGVGTMAIVKTVKKIRSKKTDEEYFEEDIEVVNDKKSKKKDK